MSSHGACQVCCHASPADQHSEAGIPGATGEVGHSLGAAVCGQHQLGRLDAEAAQPLGRRGHPLGVTARSHQDSDLHMHPSSVEQISSLHSPARPKIISSTSAIAAAWAMSWR